MSEIKNYLKKIHRAISLGDAREESFYPCLKDLLESVAPTSIDVTVLPKKTEAGNPDFRIWDGKFHITGYIEAKAPGANLDKIETSPQLKRYLNTFDNLILTDFFEFRLYRQGKMIDRVLVARPFIAQKLKTMPPIENEQGLKELLDRFFSFSLPRTFSASSLAQELAKRTRFLRDEVVFEELRQEEKGSGDIAGFYEAFKKYLIAGLSKKDFADIYSQTITYGLFAARTRAGKGFNRKIAFDYIPKTIGILRDVFQFVSLGDLPKQMEVIVDDIAQILNVADLRKILHDYYSKGKGADPIIHFYETFLDRYDPETREKRGVYYTPEPVVSFIVRSIHYLLKTRFSISDGLADKKVTLLDPAAGTLTFPAEAIKLAISEFIGKYGRGGLKHFVQSQILNNCYAFELMMAPYAIGHLKISFLLEELGYELQEDDRFRLYLTNTLEMEEIERINIPGLSALSEESRQAGRVKKKESILVILGNPPYSANSANRNRWTERLLKTDIDGVQNYYIVDDKPLGEKNSKLLQDDYVKFLRFAQWKMHKSGQGIVGMITNHGYLDNPTFRGMRQSLMKTFNEIFILNLHGNSLKRETAPDGGKDENVFDIRQGVSITLFVKQKGKTGCAVHYADLYGKRIYKYDWLSKHDINSASFKKVSPQSPWYFFVPRNIKGLESYLTWPKITEIFPVSSTGVKTHRDHFVIACDKNELRTRILMLTNRSIPDEIISESFNLKDKKNWQLRKARQKIMAEARWENFFADILYRPFDKRVIYYHDALIERPRMNVMRHMLAGENLSLLVGRQGQVVGSQLWDLVLVSRNMIDFNAFYRGGAVTFPLYLYPGSGPKNLFSFQDVVREPNIAPIILERLENAYSHRPSPEEILYYIYAVFYSNSYREKYMDFLKIDFPHVPFVLDYTLFSRMAHQGKRLINLHLLQGDEITDTQVRYEGSGEHEIIEKIVYKKQENRVYINREMYFEPIAPDVWEYDIGGYQVMQKYLKDRKGRKMDDFRHYILMATAIEKTIEIQKEIDSIYEDDACIVFL